MPLVVQSMKLLDRIEEIIEGASAVDNIAVSLRVPDELIWWGFLEFGTAARGDNPTGGYEIVPVQAKLLQFFDRAMGQFRSEKEVFMPGIPAFHMITSIYDDIRAYEQQFVRQAIMESNYNFEVVRERIYTEMMPQIQEMIVASFRDNLPNEKNSIRPLGRLAEHASQAFEEGLEIV